MKVFRCFSIFYLAFSMNFTFYSCFMNEAQCKGKNTVTYVILSVKEGIKSYIKR